MTMTDPVADFLTRLRNAAKAQHQDVAIPSSKLKRELARILKEQGYIDGYQIEPPVPGRPGEQITITLKYTENRKRGHLRTAARVAAGAAHVRRSHPHSPHPGGHGHRHHLDLQRGHDRSRGAPAGRRRRSRGAGLVTLIGHVQDR